MTISFNSIPSALRVPFVTAEFDASRASQGPALLHYNGLIIAPKTSAGTQTADTWSKVTSADDVRTKAGARSVAYRMAKEWFANNTTTPLYLGVVAEPGAGVAATGTITFSGTSTAAGTIHLYLGGVYVPVAVASGTASTAVATAVAAAISAVSDIPVTASASTSVVTVTFATKGLVGNGYDIAIAPYDGQSNPAGITQAIVGMSGGTAAPTLTTLIAALADEWFQVIAHPFTDATSLAAIEAELASRFGPMRMIDGLAITGAVDSLGNLTTLGNGRNSPHSCIVANASPSTFSPSWELAAGVAAVVALYGQIDPARPFQTLPVAGIVPLTSNDVKFTLQERNNLLFDGIATTTQDAGGVTRIERLITTYQTNAAGGTDAAYLDANTMLTLMYLRYSFRQRILSKYPRHKLANDGAKYGAGQAVMTPLLGKAEAVSWFLDMAELGLVDASALEQFKRDLVVERNATDVNRLDFLLPPDLINQLIVTAAKIQFIL